MSVASDRREQETRLDAGRSGGRRRFRRQSPSSVASDRREQETRVFPMIMFFEIEAARPLRVEDGRAVYVSCKKVRYLSEARFLCPSGTRNARFFVLRHRAWGTGGKRQPCGLLRTAQSDPKVGSETSGGRGQRPPRRLSDRESAPNPGRARREACALWALGPKAQSDPQRGSETMSATVREARMIEQPGRPLHPIHSPCLPSFSQYSGRTCSNLSPYLSGSPPANVSRRA